MSLMTEKHTHREGLITVMILLWITVVLGNYYWFNSEYYVGKISQYLSRIPEFLN